MILGALLALAVPVAVIIPVTVSAAEIQNSVCSGANNLAVTTNPANDACKDTATGGVSSVNKLITQIVNILSVIVGVVAVIMIIFGGFKYITSGGKQESVTAAKNTILYALIGLIIVALAQIIVKFVLNRATQ